MSRKANQVSTWKRQAVEGMAEGMADVFARGGKAEGPTEAEAEELHAMIGRLAVETEFLSAGLYAVGRQANAEHSAERR